MPGFDFEISIEGQKEFSRRLLVVADGIRNFRQPLEQIGGELLKSFDLNFDTRGELFGGWPERKQDYEWPLLERTGAMRGGFRSVLNPPGSPREVVLWNVEPYFKFHQSNKDRNKIPRRVMMKIDNERRNFIIRAFQSYIHELKGLHRV